MSKATSKEKAEVGKMIHYKELIEKVINALKNKPHMGKQSSEESVHSFQWEQPNSCQCAN